MKKSVLLCLILFATLFYSTNVNAGGGYSFPSDFISGIRSDGTIDSGSVLSINKSKFLEIDSGFEEGYNTNSIDVYWIVSDTAIGSGTKIYPDYDHVKGIFTQIIEQKYHGKYFTLYVDGDYNSFNWNNNTPSYKVNSITDVKGTINITPNVSYSKPNATITWSFNSNFTSGTFVERLDVSTANVVKLGNVSSDYSYTKYIDNTVSASKTYKYRIVKGSNYSNWSKTISIPNNSSGGSGGSSSGSGSGGSSGSGSSGSGSGSYSKPAKLSDANVYVISTTPGTATISMTGHDYGIGVEVYSGNTRIINKLLGYYSNYTTNVSIPYGSTTTFKYRVSRYGKDYSPWGTLSVKSAKLKRPGLSVTKINATKAGLRWSSVGGATGYRIYKGKKLVKTLGKKKSSYIYKGKGAGSAKFYVQAIRMISGKKYATGPKSKAKKGKANVRTYNFSSSTSGMKYGKAAFSPKKISLKGNTYTITCYIKNSRIFKLIKFKKLDITLLCNGKKVAHKKLTNYKVNVKKDGSKKMTIKIKGKGGVDFRNAQGTTIKWSTTPYWESVGAKPF